MTSLELTFLLLITAVYILIYLRYLRHDSRLPPCPVTPWPLVGNLVHLEENPRRQILRWREQFGDIYSLYMGSILVIVLNGYGCIKEALVHKGNITSDRPYFFYDVASGYRAKGISFSSGREWKEQREVTVTALRSLGMGKNVMAERISEIADHLMTKLASLKGQPADISNLITFAVAKVIGSMVTGECFQDDDEDFQRTFQYFSQNIADAGPTALPNYFPFLQYFPGDLFKAKSIKSRAHYIMNTFIAKYIQRKGYDEFDENNTDNFIAAYVKEMNRKLNAGQPTTMDTVNLKRCIYDLFGAGTETSSTTLSWCVLYLLHNPDMQEKLHEEIAREVGTHRLPNMNDKIKLVYLNAFILEIERLADIVPFNLLHLNSEEFTLRGYTIPKGTRLLPNLDSVLWEKEIWGEDAMSFRPDRFIDQDGKLKHFEEFIPFSLGKRACAGEALAVTEIFLFFATMIQRFKFLPATPTSLPSLQDVFGFTARPAPYEVRAIDRRTLT